MEMGENNMGGDAILEELRSIAFLGGELEIPESHILSGREGQTNWGASGSFAEYLIDVSADVLSGAGAAGIGVLVHGVFSRIRARPDSPREPLSIHDARELLKSHISLHYGIPCEGLIEKQSSSSLTDGVKEFGFVAPDGTEFGGSVGGEDPLRCTKVWRKSADPLMRPEYRPAGGGADR
ncbi:hypothetical protein O1M63_30900 [Streptomyces mirabilis]|nr:hypothetical protein [Streptomyces mirabilis]